MSSQFDYIDYLRDMLDATEKIEHFTFGLSFLEFIGDDKTVFAVARALEVIGEAAKRIPRSVQGRHDEIPWRAMAGMRDKLAHDYNRVNTEVIWRTVQDDLPLLQVALTRLVAELGDLQTDP